MIDDNVQQPRPQTGPRSINKSDLTLASTLPSMTVIEQIGPLYSPPETNIEQVQQDTGVFSLTRYATALYAAGCMYDYTRIVSLLKI